MGSIRDNLQAVHQRIAEAAKASGRSLDTLSLLAVSKTWPASAVEEAVAAGQRAFGENYVQEGVDKVRALRAQGLPPLEWHFIGPLQSNKSRLVAEHFDWVHSVDRLKIGERLSLQRPSELGRLNVCIQVNISGESSKSGCAPEEVLAIGKALSVLPGLHLRGLMAIPEPAETFEAQMAPFLRLRQLFEQMQQAGLAVDTLSMGMSHDLEAAVAAGATIVRVGTAIFGQREYI